MVAADRAVHSPGRQRDGALDRLTYGRTVDGQVGGGVLRAHRDHAAADVDADGGGDDGVPQQPEDMSAARPAGLRRGAT